MPYRPIIRGIQRQERKAALFDTLGYADFNGDSAGVISTPDHTSLDITGDIDIRVCVRAADYTPAALNQLVSKWQAGSNQRSYEFSIPATTGVLEFAYTTDGTTGTNVSQSSSAASLVDGQAYWLRVTNDADDGAGNHVVSFYKSSDPISTTPRVVEWTLISSHTVAGTTAMFSGSAALQLGKQGNTALTLTGLLYYAEVRSGIGEASPLATDPDFRDRDQYTTATTLTDSTGKVFTFTSPTFWVLPKQQSLTNANIAFYPHFPRNELRVVRR